MYKVGTGFIHIVRDKADPLLFDVRHAVGRSTAAIYCPCCGYENRVYIWSFNGSGKRCENCLALVSRHGASLRADKMSPEDWEFAISKSKTV